MLWISEVSDKGNSSYSPFSQEEADSNLQYLDDNGCTDCAICFRCRNCSRCNNCSDCVDCIRCIDCKMCASCVGTGDCLHCTNANAAVSKSHRLYKEITRETTLN